MKVVVNLIFDNVEAIVFEAALVANVFVSGFMENHRC